MNIHSIFRLVATTVSNVAGSAYTFVAAMVLILIWIVSGPIFKYSDTWQLSINTLTTIITFLMVFLIQNTQNRDSKALHLKLDELVKSNKKARDQVIDVENLPDEVIEEMREEFKKLQTKYVSKNTGKKEEHISTIQEVFDKLFGLLEKDK